MNNHNLFYEITLDICHARTPTYKWRYVPWRTKENEPIQTKYASSSYTPLPSVKCHFKFSKSRNSSENQDKQGSKAF